ncbi:Unconventional myosinIXblike, partial [Caligus rogercresseyi]
EEKAVEDTEIILDCYQRLRRANNSDENPPERKQRNGEWAMDANTSSSASIRNIKRNTAASRIQALYRGYRVRKAQGPSLNKINRFPEDNSNLPPRNPGRPRPAPISGTPPPEINGFPPGIPGQNFGRHPGSDRCDFQTIQQTCALFGLDL